MRMESPKGSPCDLIASPDLPHSLHAFRRMPKTDPQDMVTMPDITPFFPLMQAYLPHLVTVCFLFGQLLFTPFFLWKNMIYHLQCISIAMLIC